MIKTIIGVIIAVIIFIFIQSGREEVQETLEQKPTASIIKDESTVFEGLDKFRKRSEIKKKVELVEKEAFLEEKRLEAIADHEKEMAEIERELDTVRGELATS